MNTEKALHELLMLDVEEYDMGDPPDVLLCEHMHRHRLRIWEVAEWLDVAPSTVGRWRSGETRMPFYAWLALHAQMYRLALATDLQDAQAQEQARAEFCANLVKR